MKIIKKNCFSSSGCKIIRTTAISLSLLTGASLCIHLASRELASSVAKNSTTRIVLWALALIASAAVFNCYLI